MQIGNIQIFESKNRREATLKTVAISLALLLVFYFVKIFETTDVVKPDYGIEVNFGTSDKGSGDIQTRNEASDIKKEIESAPPKEIKKEVVKTAPPVEKAVEKVKVKATPTKTESAITSKVESPVKMKEITDNKAKVTPVKVEPKVVKTAPVATPSSPPAKPTPKVDEGSLFKKAGGKGGNGTIGSTTEKGGNNNGDGAKGEIGDKGDPSGKINESTIYKGKSGSGGASGSGLSLTGWTWSKKPVVTDDSDEIGYIKFEIKVDDQGDIISVRPLQFTVSQSVVNAYKKAIEKVSFTATSNGARPSVSIGTIMIKINSRN